MVNIAQTFICQTYIVYIMFTVHNKNGLKFSSAELCIKFHPAGNKVKLVCSPGRSVYPSLSSSHHLMGWWIPFHTLNFTFSIAPKAVGLQATLQRTYTPAHIFPAIVISAMMMPSLLCAGIFLLFFPPLIFHIGAHRRAWRS